MSDNIEIEAKVLINESQYEKAVEYLQDEPYHRFIQVNYYIDSEDRTLYKIGCSMRIRKKDNYELTLKIPMSEGLLEKSQIITNEEYKTFAKKKIFPEGDIKKFLMILGMKIEKLAILTSLSTDRIELPYGEGVLCVDKNTYNGQTDYELEMEHSSMENAEKNLETFVKALDIKDFSYNTVSKQRRAMLTIK